MKLTVDTRYSSIWSGLEKLMNNQQLRFSSDMAQERVKESSKKILP